MHRTDPHRVSVPEELEHVADTPIVMTPRQVASIVRQAVSEALQSLPATPAAETLLTRVELAERLRCSTATVDRAVRDGMPFCKLADDKRFDFGAVRRWLAERSRGDQLVGGARMAGRVERN